MKKLLTLISLSTMAIGVGASFAFIKPNEQVKAASISYDYNQYNHYQQFWNEDIIYNESTTFVEQSDYTTVSGRLFYDIDELISVRDCNLNEVSLDNFTVVGNEIRLKQKFTPPDGIRWFTYDNYMIPKQTIATNGYMKFLWPADVGYTQANISGQPEKYVIWSEGIAVARMFYYVTYKKKSTSTWTANHPEPQKEKLKNTINKLSNNENINIVFNGDSIVTGAICSGYLNKSLNLSGDNYLVPNEAIYSTGFKNELVRIFGYNDASKVNVVNTAVGGTQSQWGKENVTTNVLNHNPDLVVLGFGTNDGCAAYQVPVATYKSNMESMVNAIKAKNSNTEIILFHAIKSNPDSPMHTYMQDQYLAPLKEIEAANSGVTVLNMYEMMETLYTKKLSLDMLANNINHPNDWLERMHVSSLLTLLGCYKDDDMAPSSSDVEYTLRAGSIKSPWGFQYSSSDYGTNGVKVKSTGSWNFGTRVTIDQKVKLDTLSFNILGEDFKTSYTQSGFYLTKNNSSQYYTECNSVVFNVHNYLWAQDRLSIASSNDNAVSASLVYKDPAHPEIKGFGLTNDATLYMVHKSNAGYNIRFDKYGNDGVYKITLKELVDGSFVNEDGQQYQIIDGKKAFVAYINIGARDGVLDSDGNTYLNFFSYDTNSNPNTNIFYDMKNTGSANKGTLIYKVDGNVYQKKAVSLNTKLSQPTAPTKQGYVFKGWYKDSGFVTPWDFNNDTFNSSKMSLYAKFVDSVTENVDVFVTNYMHPEVPTSEVGTGKCISEGWYSAAKTAFNALGTSEKTLFKTGEAYKAPYARLQAWAKANHETFENGVFSSNTSITNIDSSNSVLTILLIVSISSLLVASSFIILKKRKVTR